VGRPARNLPTDTSGEDLRTTFAANLQEAREGAGLSLREVARRAGTTHRYVGKIESHAINITLDMAAALAHAVHVNVRTLLNRKNHSGPF
jgi:transcriptional regulator with XRE-family HTH domain